jgi:signal transduction histidine kinase
MSRSCDDATGIVSDILDFDKIGEGKMTLECAKVCPLAPALPPTMMRLAPACVAWR